LGTLVAPANHHDSPLLEGTLETLGPLGELPDQASVHLDRAYDSAATREKLAARCLLGEISKKGKSAPLRAWMRWVVERTLSWIDQNRRMSKDYERFLCASGEAFVYAAMIRLMTRRLARV
jgi:transposase